MTKGVENMPEIAAWSERIKAFRYINHESQAEFAANVGVSEDEISLIECGRANPRLDTLQKLAAYMNITVSDLLLTKER